MAWEKLLESPNVPKLSELVEENTEDTITFLDENQEKLKSTIIKNDFGNMNFFDFMKKYWKEESLISYLHDNKDELYQKYSKLSDEQINELLDLWFSNIDSHFLDKIFFLLWKTKWFLNFYQKIHDKLESYKKEWNDIWFNKVIDLLSRMDIGKFWDDILFETWKEVLNNMQKLEVNTLIFLSKLSKTEEQKDVIWNLLLEKWFLPKESIDFFKKHWIFIYDENKDYDTDKLKKISWVIDSYPDSIKNKISWLWYIDITQEVWMWEANWEVDFDSQYMSLKLSNNWTNRDSLTDWYISKSDEFTIVFSHEMAHILFNKNPDIKKWFDEIWWGKWEEANIDSWNYSKELLKSETISYLKLSLEKESEINNINFINSLIERIEKWEAQNLLNEAKDFVSNNRYNSDKNINFKTDLYLNMPLYNEFYINYTRYYWWKKPENEDFSTFVEAYFSDSELLEKEALRRKEAGYPVLYEKYQYVNKLFEWRKYKVDEKWKVSYN